MTHDERTTGTRVALVTGGAKGIGLAISTELAGRGYQVVIGGRDEAAITAAVADIQQRDGDASAFGVALDVTCATSVAAAFDTVGGRFPHLSALVNNAGLIVRSPSAELDEEDWSRVVNTDLSGVFRCTQAAFPLLSAAPGAAVVNVSSIAASLGIEERAGYTAAKAGVEGLTRTLALEWGPIGIRVNCLAPGWTRTDMVEHGIAQGKLDTGRLERRAALRRLAQPGEIAAAAAFLLSADASFVTGTTLVVDGGYTINGNG